MALFRKMGKLLKNSGVNYDLSMSTPSVFQTIRSMSSAKLFVGGLSYNTDETSLRKHFARYGEVLDAKIIMDRNIGRPQDFGFITFATTEQASAALQTINLAIKTMKIEELYGRMVRVNYVTERSHPKFGNWCYGVLGSYHGSHLKNSYGSHLKNSYAAGGELNRNIDLGYDVLPDSDLDDEMDTLKAEVNLLNSLKRIC